ncbi:MAG TPA: adenylate kinase [Gemmataceae bacterium]|nr:adenylate kinase [Gemmataceae bacterium]
MRLILLGPPGCGKGTQAKLLSQRKQLEHIGTGDILREAIRQETAAGSRAKPYVDAGKLVPDDLVNDVIAERFNRDDRPERFVMDGYPRTLAQAAAFDQVLRQQFLELTAVILLQVEDEEIIGRVSERWSCPKAGCKATYHTMVNPPKTRGICDYCGTKLVQREDDDPKTVRARLVVYHGNTEALVGHYQAQGLLHEVRGCGPIEEVYAKMIKILNCQAGPTC